MQTRTPTTIGADAVRTRSGMTRTGPMIVLCAGLLLAASGCASIASANKIRPHSPRFYAGTRLDLAAIDRDRDTLDHFSTFDILPPPYPGADLVLSVLADTAFLPFAAIYTISEPVLWKY